MTNLYGSLNRVEICAGSVQSAINAYRGGATRIEFCQHLDQGGFTPSLGALQQVRDQVPISIQVLIRCRRGHFVYSEREMETMLKDIAICRSMGMEGVVIGALSENGSLHEAYCREMIDAAGDLQITFHRAIDEINDPISVLPKLHELGFERVLTSGGSQKAINGVETITNMVNAAPVGLTIMAGSGIKTDQLNSLITQTGVKEIHTTARKELVSTVRRGLFYNPEIPISETSVPLVKELIRYEKKKD